MNILKLAKGVSAYSRKWHAAALKSCDINDAIESTVHGDINAKQDFVNYLRGKGRVPKRGLIRISAQCIDSFTNRTVMTIKLP